MIHVCWNCDVLKSWRADFASHLPDDSGHLIFNRNPPATTGTTAAVLCLQVVDLGGQPLVGSLHFQIRQTGTACSALNKHVVALERFICLCQSEVLRPYDHQGAAED